jgi:phosphinothricin acetyltransferase
MSDQTGVVVRRGKESDLSALLTIYNHYIRTTPFTFDLSPVMLEERRSWMAQFQQTGPYQLFVAENVDGLLGYACSGPFRPKAAYASSVETSVYLVPTVLGRGLGFLLMERLLSELRSAPVHRAYALITTPNPTSERLHAHFGYRLAGTLSESGRKFDTWHSVGIWELAFPG